MSDEKNHLSSYSLHLVSKAAPFSPPDSVKSPEEIQDEDVYVQYELVDSSEQTMWRRATSAAVMEPIGLKANWSEKQRPGGGYGGVSYRCMTLRCSFQEAGTRLT